MAVQQSSISEVVGEHISLSKFAKCLCISRPTLYKYMDAYDSKDIDLIPDNVLKVFDTVSSDMSKKGLQAYLIDLYIDYTRTEERRLREYPVPSDIAEIVDGEGLDVKDIDLMIEKAEKHLNRLMKKDSPDEDEIEHVKKDIRDLGYTREMVEKRQSENRFLLIFSDMWTACIGPDESDTVDLDEEAESDIPAIKEKFRFNLVRAKSGYTLFFYNDSEGDTVEVQLLTGFGDDLTEDIVGTFHPEPGMKFVRIPDLFDENYEESFMFRIIRSNKGVVLNKALGKFTI